MGFFATLFSNLFKSKSEKKSPDLNLDEAPEEISFRYGSGRLVLQKSKTLAGIRPKQGRQEGFGSSSRNLSQPLGMLGGFTLVELTQSRSLENAESEIDRLRSDPNISLATHVYHSPGSDTPYVPTGEVYVVFKSNADPRKWQALLKDHGLMVISSKGERAMVTRITKTSQNPLKVAASLQNSDLIEIAEPDLAAPVEYNGFEMPADHLFPYQWHLHNPGFEPKSGLHSNLFREGADAKVVEAWKAMNGLGSPSVIIAVVDDGFDLKHPDFETGGKIVHPWDFISSSPEMGIDFGDWHGTQCAGVALAAANGKGTVGVAPNARFMPLRNGEISDRQIEFIFSHAMENGADIISNSWGVADPAFRLSTRQFETIRTCAREGRNGRGCVIVFAAGNENRQVSGFATHPDVITVSASTSMDERADYSNFGSEVSVCAPSSGAGGWPVLTTDVGLFKTPEGVEVEGGHSAGLYHDGFGGTSSACPLVAGICALLLSVNPRMTASEVKQILEMTAEKIGPAANYSNGHSPHFGHGRVNALLAIQKTADLKPDLSGGVVEDVVLAGSFNGRFYNPEEQQLFRFEISHDLEIRLKSQMLQAEEVEMFLKRGDVPEPENGHFDFSSKKQGDGSALRVTNPSAGTYYLLVRPLNKPGDFDLEFRHV